MDIFFEQIVPVKKTLKDIFALIGIWFAVIAVLVLVILFIGLNTLGLLILALAIYFAYKFSGNYSIEYEYIVTNGTVDIDKIMAKRSRKRILSFEASEIESVERYNPDAKDTRTYSEIVFACNKKDANAYRLVISKAGLGSKKLIISPNNDIKEAIKKFMPKIVGNKAFND